MKDERGSRLEVDVFRQLTGLGQRVEVEEPPLPDRAVLRQGLPDGGVLGGASMRYVSSVGRAQGWVVGQVGGPVAASARVVLLIRVEPVVALAA